MGYRRRTLGEHAELAQLQAERSSLGDRLVAADTVISDLEDEQVRAESELEPVRQRLARNQQRISDGTVPDPKALGAMIEEVEHLQRRIATLEDAELEVMEQLETAVRDRELLHQQAAALERRLAEVTARRDEHLAALDDTARQRAAERQTVAPEIPNDLMALYTKIAAARGGVGAAELVRRRCTGCQLELNAADLGAIGAAADDEVVRCEECSRILVRTEQSGL